MTGLLDLLVAVAVATLGTFLGGLLLALVIRLVWKRRKPKMGDIFYDKFYNRNEWKMNKKGKWKHKDDKLF